MFIELYVIDITKTTRTVPILTKCQLFLLLVFVFQEMGKNIVTVQEVVDEITSKRQLRRLIVLPYELKIMHVFPENVSFSKPNLYNT